MVIKSTNSDDIGYGDINYGATISSGRANDKGLFYGLHDQYQNSVVKVFGMENWFGNRFRRLAGLWIGGDTGTKWKYKLTYDRSDGTTDAGYAESDTEPTNYIVGNTFQTGNGYYISAHRAYTNGALLISGTSGDNGTYYSDQVSAQGGSAAAYVGGKCDTTSPAGAFYVYGWWQFSVNTNADSGLSLKPLNTN